MKEYQAYLFDADGTLMDTRELIFKSFLHMAEIFSLPPPSREVVDAGIGLVLRPQIVAMLGKDRPETDYQAAHEAYHDYHQLEYRKHLRLFPGVSEGLAELAARGKKLAVVSSRSRPGLDRFLGETGILGLFQAVVGPGDTTRHKPDSEPALKALELLGAEPGEAVFIGDAEFDMACGKGAGLDAVHVKWGGMDPAGWPVKPDLSVGEFRELLP